MNQLVQELIKDLLYETLHICGQINKIRDLQRLLRQSTPALKFSQAENKGNINFIVVNFSPH